MIGLKRVLELCDSHNKDNFLCDPPFFNITSIQCLKITYDFNHFNISENPKPIKKSIETLRYIQENV